MSELASALGSETLTQEAGGPPELRLTGPSIVDMAKRIAEFGLCSQTDPEAFFPEKGGLARAAKQTCLACEVRDECLEYAIENGEQYGMWGGKSEHERRKIKRQRKAVV